MQVAVLLTWIPSRVAEPGAVGETFRKFLFLEGDLGVVGVGLARIGVPTALLVLTGFAGLHVLSYRVRGIHCHAAALATPGFLGGCLVAGVVLYLFWPLSTQPFVYFQF